MASQQQPTTRHGNAIIGCALGDCAGLPFENRAPPPPGWTLAHIDGATCWSENGAIWSDDTQQSLILLDDFLRHGALSPARIMARFVAYRQDAATAAQKFGLHRGTGRGFRFAVDEFIKLGTYSPLQGRIGNGAAMRVASVAWAMPHATPPQREQSLQQIEAVSRMTHGEDGAVHAALAVALACWFLEASEPGAGADAAVAAAGIVEYIYSRLPAGVLRDSVFCQLRLPGCVPLELLPQITGVPLGDGHAFGGPLAAIFLATQASSCVDAIERAVRMGGDTDSTAAIAGAIYAGARGLGGTPSHLLKGVQQAGALLAWDVPPADGAAVPTVHPVDVERAMVFRHHARRY